MFELGFRVLVLDHSILQVSEMKAEYFPPREEIILQNEAPTDLYILVNGAVVQSLSLSLCFCLCLSPLF